MRRLWMSATGFLLKRIYTAADMIQRHGLMKFFFIIIPWFFCRRYAFLSVSTAGPLTAPKPEIPLRVDLAKREDLPGLCRLRPFFYTLPQLHERMDQGHLCFLGWYGKELVHIRWVLVNSYFVPFLQKIIELRPGEAYTDEAFTVPKYRGMGVYSHFGFQMRRILNSMGYERHVTIFPTWDESIIKSAERNLFMKVGEGGYINILGCKRYFWRGKVVADKDRISVAL
jgi:hypothetical protein